MKECTNDLNKQKNKTRKLKEDKYIYMKSRHIVSRLYLIRH